jgi:hypothetical protein
MVSSQNESFLNPQQHLRETEVSLNFMNLIHSQRSRYEEQARKLLKERHFEIEIEGFLITYSVKNERFVSEIFSKDQKLASYESEIPIPISEEEKISALVEFFAHSEAGKIG